MNNNNNEPKLISMADVEEKECEWLVPGYMPRGQICILAGDGGSGKTTIWCAIASAVSNGAKVFFDNTPDEFVSYTSENVLFLSAEDSLECTLKAKLRKSGANLKNITTISIKDEVFQQMKFDSKCLKDTIARDRPSLVIFDPIQAFIPSNIQMGQRNAMRNCLSPLITLGEEYGTTFLIVVHTNKRQGTYGRNRIADSADVWDIARSVLIAGQTSNNGIRYLSHEKSNYGKLSDTALFTIDDGVAVMQGYTTLRDADYVKERDYTAHQAPQRQDAKTFIMQYLNNGKQKTADLDQSAKSAGISESTLKRAKRELHNEGILGYSNSGYGRQKEYYSFLKEPPQ